MSTLAQNPRFHGVTRVASSWQLPLDGRALVGAARRLAYKPAARYVHINGGPPARFVGATAGDGLPLRLSPGLDYPPPFNVAVGAPTISLSQDWGAVGGTPLTYRFYEQRVV